MPFNTPFADRLNNVETSAIRELFKLLGKPGIISFAGGFPDSAMFDVDGIREAVNTALSEEAGAALQYGATEGYNPLREQLAAFMVSKGSSGVKPDDLIVTTGGGNDDLVHDLPRLGLPDPGIDAEAVHPVGFFHSNVIGSVVVHSESGYAIPH